MAIIDYIDVTSMRYAQLSLPAKALIPVLATLADKKTGLVPERQSKLDILAAFAGISRRATEIALRLLADTKRISLTLVHGHPAQIIYQPISQFSSRAGHAPHASLDTHVMRDQPELNFPPDARPDTPKAERHDSCSNSFFKQFKQHTLSSLTTVIADFYSGIGQNRIAKTKRERGINVGKKLRKDGFSLEDIAFAVAWTLENAEKELYDFAIIEYTIGQALAARDKIESQTREIEERDKSVEEERSKRETEERDRQEIEEHKISLSPKEREELQAKARAELGKLEVPAGIINDFLVKMKENEILRTSGHARAATSF